VPKPFFQSGYKRMEADKAVRTAIRQEDQRIRSRTLAAVDEFSGFTG
jgi:hypothetical protein